MLILGIIDIPTWLILIIFICGSLYWLGTWNQGFLKKRGIPSPPPLPFIGNLHSFFTADLYTYDSANRKKYGDIFGFYIGNSPELIIFDHDILSEVAIKQFQNFADRRDNFLGEHFEGSLFFLCGERWKKVRSHMSPAFTTGKLRKMSVEINRCAQSLSDRLIGIEGTPFEAKELTDAYTMDCIASTGFGLRVDSQKDANNSFSVNGKKMIDINIKSLKFILSFILPTRIKSFMLSLGFSFDMLDNRSLDFFAKVFEQTMKNRNEGDKNRVDFLQLMVNAQQGLDISDMEETEGPQSQSVQSSNKKDLTQEEIMGNALFLFAAAFDTTSLGLTQLLYCLACDQECQDTLIEELDAVLEDAEGVINYDTLGKMKYLEACINETLRLYSPVIRVERKALCNMEIKGLKIDKGMMVNIPILAIHHDPEIWPEPEKFIPERFMPERKATVKVTHHMPFGIGPRICIGNRLAMFEIKAGLVHLLRTHRVVTCEKTEIPLKMSGSKAMKAENGVWLEVQKRT